MTTLTTETRPLLRREARTLAARIVEGAITRRDIAEAYREDTGRGRRRDQERLVIK